MNATDQYTPPFTFEELMVELNRPGNPVKRTIDLIIIECNKSRKNKHIYCIHGPVC